jgi:hypothetical protein
MVLFAELLQPEGFATACATQQRVFKAIQSSAAAVVPIEGAPREKFESDIQSALYACALWHPGFIAMFKKLEAPLLV